MNSHNKSERTFVLSDSTVFSGANQVDGLPPAFNRDKEALMVGALESCVVYRCCRWNLPGCAPKCPKPCFRSVHVLIWLFCRAKLLWLVLRRENLLVLSV